MAEGTRNSLTPETPIREDSHGVALVKSYLGVMTIFLDFRSEARARSQYAPHGRINSHSVGGRPNQASSFSRTGLRKVGSISLRRHVSAPSDYDRHPPGSGGSVDDRSADRLILLFAYALSSGPF